ncbi:MAG TPA: hypothetical protein PKC69_14790 [Chitinophagaceae bacterium]|nr:hypothetical protein [Chitinophagaceae bacterium]
MATTKGTRLGVLLTPVRMILPGVIVSLIGASLAYYLFNNPKKIRGRATHTAWGVINEYEQLYQNNVDMFGCAPSAKNEAIDKSRFFKDLLHQQEVMLANLETIKLEKDVDSKLISLLNIKVSCYKELQQLTRLFLDTMQAIDAKMQNQGFYTQAAYLEELKAAQDSYILEKDYVQSRDTVTISRLLEQLGDKYGLVFEQVLEQLPVDKLPEMIKGAWSISGSPATVIVRQAGRGTWRDGSSNKSYDFSWAIEDGNILEIKLDDDPDDENINRWTILRCTDKVLSFYDMNAKVVLAACK